LARTAARSPASEAADRPPSFGERLAAGIARSGPLCVGIEPTPELLSAWGLPDTADGLRAVADRCLTAFAGTVPAVKPQVAFWERHGSRGIAALERLLGDARDAGLMVIADAKRGDIASISTAYATAWLDPASPLRADALTVSPYLGLGALTPIVDTARAHGGGVIVVVRSGNREGRLVQQASAAGGSSVQDRLLAGIAGLNRAEIGQGVRIGSVGAVVAATLQPSGYALGRLGGPLLAPGVGAQGATVADVAALFHGCSPGTVLPSVSRAVLVSGPTTAALREAAERLRDGLAAALR
jgi:orotidine-5'-phosphate decarboxylase